MKFELDYSVIKQLKVFPILTGVFLKASKNQARSSLQKWLQILSQFTGFRGRIRTDWNYVSEFWTKISWYRPFTIARRGLEYLKIFDQKRSRFPDYAMRINVS